jgi:hypothetical protein
MRGAGLKQFRNYGGLVKGREEWFSLGENHERACGFGLHQLRNCFRWQLFVKFDIFGSFWGLATQRGRAKGFFFIEKPTLMSGTEAKTGT